jgi:hypothetical protein
MADRLTLVRALEESGMASTIADRVASEIYDAIHENVATKSDIAAVRSDIDVLRAATKSDIAAVRADMREMEQRLERQIDRVVVRLGALVVIVSGVLFAALRYWPPH